MVLFRHFGVEHGRMLLEFALVQRSQRRHFRMWWLSTKVDDFAATATLSVSDLVYVGAFLPSEKGQRGDHVVVVLGGECEAHLLHLHAPVRGLHVAVLDAQDVQLCLALRLLFAQCLLNTAHFLHRQTDLGRHLLVF